MYVCMYGVCVLWVGQRTTLGVASSHLPLYRSHFFIQSSVDSYCLNCFFVVVKRQHNQGNLYKSLLRPMVPEGESSESSWW